MKKAKRMKTIILMKSLAKLSNYCKKEQLSSCESELERHLEERGRITFIIVTAKIFKCISVNDDMCL